MAEQCDYIQLVVNTDATRPRTKVVAIPPGAFGYMNYRVRSSEDGEDVFRHQRIGFYTLVHTLPSDGNAEIRVVAYHVEACQESGDWLAQSPPRGLAVETGFELEYDVPDGEPACTLTIARKPLTNLDLLCKAMGARMNKPSDDENVRLAAQQYLLFAPVMGPEREED
jgi:hypothetical protein